MKSKISCLVILFLVYKINIYAKVDYEIEYKDTCHITSIPKSIMQIQKL